MEEVLHAVGLCPDSSTHVSLLLFSFNEMRNLLLTFKIYAVCLLQM